MCASKILVKSHIQMLSVLQRVKPCLCLPAPSRLWALPKNKTLSTKEQTPAGSLAPRQGTVAARHAVSLSLQVKPGTELRMPISRSALGVTARSCLAARDQELSLDPCPGGSALGWYQSPAPRSKQSLKATLEVRSSLSPSSPSPKEAKHQRKKKHFLCLVALQHFHPHL